MVCACAVSALAMVFSVQQGEHGPLVVYKLEVPRSAGPVSPAPATAPAPVPPMGRLGRVVIPRAQAAPVAESAPRAAAPAAPRAPRLSPLEPTILGTVAMPVAGPGAALAPAPVAAPAALPIPLVPAQPAPTSVELDPFAFADRYHGSSDPDEDDGVLINATTGEIVTLQEVNDAVAWRRETAEKLRQLPVGPRF